MLNKVKKHEDVAWRTSLLCANLPEECKLANSLSEFKSKIKSLKSDAWVCHLC